MKRHLLVGGLVAVGFDASGAYLLTISHSGRGVFSTTTWERVARNPGLAYPKDGKGVGIGPIEGQEIPVVEFDSTSGIVEARSADGRIILRCESSGIVVDT
jgi:hypothetical protein